MGRFALIVCIGIGLLHTPALAQEPGRLRWEIDEKALPKGISAQRAAELTATLRKLDVQRVAAREKQQQSLRENVMSVTQPTRDQVNRVLARDRALEQAMDDFVNGIQDTLQGDFSDEERRRRLEALRKEYRPKVEEVLKLAGFDERAEQKFRSDVEKVFGFGSVKKRGLGEWIEWILFGAWEVRRNIDTEQTRPSEVELTLKAPYPYKETEKNGNNMGYAEADLEAGTFRARAQVMGAGGHTNRAGLAHFLPMPPGYSRVLVTATLPETEWSVVAANIGGAFGASASSRVVVLAQNEIVCDDYQTHGDVWTAVAWAAEKEGTSTLAVECSFDAPPADTELTIRFTAEANAWGFGGGAAETIMESAPQDIRINLFR